MTAGLYGLLAAFGCGNADFIARFTGRHIGYQQALFGMTTVSAIVLSLIFWWLNLKINLDVSGLWLLLVSGIGIMLSTMLLYKGIAMGPVSIVSPTVGSFPIFNVALAIIMGTHPDLLQWFAMISVIGGVWIVGYASGHFLHEVQYDKQHLRQAIIIAICASFGFGISVAAAQAATHYYGEIQTICISRWIGLLVLSLYFAVKHIVPNAFICWPLIVAQGLLDTMAYVTLMLAALTDTLEIAVVTSSGFCIVTILLARTILNECISFTQWAGIVFIVGGVAVLSVMS